jgi:hypothetical protein
MPRMSVIGYAIDASPSARRYAPITSLIPKPPALSLAACRSKASARASRAKSGRTLSDVPSMTRKSKMIPTAFSAAGAIHSEIGDQPSDEFVHCPNAFPALSARLVHNVHSSGRDKYAPPGRRPFDALGMSKRGRALQRCNAVPARQQKECGSDVAMTKPAL